jgi:gliding motility-associated-like protein
MKKGLVLIAFMTAGYHCFGQCTFPSTLKANDSVCLGNDTLFVSAPGNPVKITWYNGNTADTTVTAITSPIIIYKDVAGDQVKGSGANQLNYPLGIFIDAAGNLYVADAENNRIQKFPPGSFYTTAGTTVAGGNGTGTAANQLSGPSATFVDATGYIYVADTYNGRIQKFPPGSTSATSGITVAGGNGVGSAANQFEPTGVYLDASGNLYVTDFMNNRILEFPPGSTSATNGITIGGGNGPGSAANQLSGAYCGIVDGNGDVYVADQVNQRVQKFPAGSTSATSGITVAGGNGIGSAPDQLEDPSAVFLDRLGNLYVEDMQNNRIQEFPPGSTSATGGFTVASGDLNGAYLDYFIGSYGLFVDSIGDIYFSDINYSRIVEMKPTFSIDTLYIPSAPGTYTAVVTDKSGCTDTTNAFVISASPSPTLTIAANSTAACAGDTVVFIASPVNPGPTPAYQWQVNGNNIGTNSDTLVISSLLNKDIVSCILISHSPCNISVPAAGSIGMSVYPLPAVSFNPDTLITKGLANTSLNPIVSGIIAAYQWTPAAGLDNPNAMSPQASPVSTTTYQLTVTTNNGCQASGKETVFVYYPLEMPNAFTPNSDGKNDVFRIPPSFSLQIKQFAVYDRWGMRVFQTTNSSIGWDGTFAGRLQPPGTYVWQVEYENILTRQPAYASGIVTLIR